MQNLTTIENEILMKIYEFKRQQGHSPTLRELSELTNIPRGSIQHHLSQIKTKGFIDWNREPRSIRFTKNINSSDIGWVNDRSCDVRQFAVPVVGKIS